MVVKEVKITALNLSHAPSITAIIILTPFLIFSSIVETIIIESLITIPAKPKSATKERIVILKPVIQWPKIEPKAANGIILITINGRK